MHEQESKEVIAEIYSAFSNLVFPGIDRIVTPGSREENIAMRRDFIEMTDWRTVSTSFLDSAPDGMASALSFFSPLGFQFYIPAYMVADLNGHLALVDPAFFLCVHVMQLRTPDGVKVLNTFDSTFPQEAIDRIRSFDSRQCSAISSYCLKMAAVKGDLCLIECSRFWRTQSSGRA